MNNDEKLEKLEITIKAKKISSIWSNNGGIFGGPRKINFWYRYNSNVYYVELSEIGNRRLFISCNKEVYVKDLLHQLIILAQLLMLLEGKFYTLDSISIESDSSTIEESKKLEKLYLSRQLKCYKSVDFVLDKKTKLISPYKVLDKTLVENWVQFLEDFQRPHMIFLYAVGDVGMTVDLRSALLTEIIASLSCLVKKHNSKFVIKTDPNTGEKTLRTKLNAMFNEYGMNIFAQELNYSNFMDIVINSRNNIMHAKQELREPYFEGYESLLYDEKAYLLYRVCCFDLLNIDIKLYSHKLEECVLMYENQTNIYNSFIDKLKK